MHELVISHADHADHRRGGARVYVREPSNRDIHTLKVSENFIPDVNIGRQLPSIPDALLAAIADEAHKNGLRVGAARDSDRGRRGPRRVGQSLKPSAKVYLGVPPQFPFVAF